MAESKHGRAPHLDVKGDVLIVNGEPLSWYPDGESWLDEGRGILYRAISGVESSRPAVSNLLNGSSQTSSTALLLKAKSPSSIQLVKEEIVKLVGNSCLVSMTAAENLDLRPLIPQQEESDELEKNGFDWKEQSVLSTDDASQIETIWRSHGAKVFSQLLSENSIQDLIERNLSLILTCKAQLILRRGNSIVGHFPRHDNRPSQLRTGTPISVIDLWVNREVLPAKLRRLVHAKAFSFFRSSGLPLEATTNPKAEGVVEYLAKNNFVFHRIMVRKL